MPMTSLAILPENGFQLLPHDDLRFLHHALFLKFVLFCSNFSLEHRQIKVKLVTCANFFFSSSNNSLLGQWMKQKLNSKLVICAHFCPLYSTSKHSVQGNKFLQNLELTKYNDVALVMPSSSRFIFFAFHSSSKNVCQLLKISTSVWVMHNQNAGENPYFLHF